MKDFDFPFAIVVGLLVVNTIWGSKIGTEADNFEEEFDRNVSAKEVFVDVKTPYGSSTKKDTVLILPLSISKEFKEKALQLIKDGKLEVAKVAPTTGTNKAYSR